MGITWQNSPQKTATSDLVAEPLINQPLETLLTSHGVNVTRPRVELAKLLFSCSQHVSAEQVLATLKQHGRRVSKATVYNTLNLFVDAGLLRAVTLAPGVKVYDTNTMVHHHFFNCDTGELIDIPANEVAINELPQAPAGTQAEGFEVVIRVRNRQP